MATRKTCSSCGEDKPLEAYRFKKGGLHLKHSFCKVCEASKQKARREKLKEENYEKYCLDIQDRMLKQNYKISLEEYQEMLAEQEYVCAICGETCSKNLAVDHNHVTGKIRGLLCQRCNRGLGFFADSTHKLQNAIKYLKEKDG